jgi:hypothetical protein
MRWKPQKMMVGSPLDFGSQPLTADQPFKFASDLSVQEKRDATDWSREELLVFLNATGGKVGGRWRLTVLLCWGQANEGGSYDMVVFGDDAPLGSSRFASKRCAAQPHRFYRLHISPYRAARHHRLIAEKLERRRLHAVETVCSLLDRLNGARGILALPSRLI